MIQKFYAISLQPSKRKGSLFRHSILEHDTLLSQWHNPVYASWDCKLSKNHYGQVIRRKPYFNVKVTFQQNTGLASKGKQRLQTRVWVTPCLMRVWTTPHLKWVWTTPRPIPNVGLSNSTPHAGLSSSVFHFKHWSEQFCVLHLMQVWSTPHSDWDIRVYNKQREVCAHRGSAFLL